MDYFIFDIVRLNPIQGFPLFSFSMNYFFMNIKSSINQLIQLSNNFIVELLKQIELGT